MIGWKTGSDIGFCKTKDFKNFEEMDNITLKDNGRLYNKVWAPAWFVDGFDYYICISGQIDDVFTMHLYKYDLYTHSVVKDIKTNINSNDYHWYYSSGKYYALGNDTLFESEKIDGIYTKIRSPRKQIEGDFALQRDDGKYNIYVVMLYDKTSSVEIGMYTIDDIESSVVGDIVPIELTDEAMMYQTEVGYKYTHCTIIDLHNETIIRSRLMNLIKDLRC